MGSAGHSFIALALSPLARCKDGREGPPPHPRKVRAGQRRWPRSAQVTPGPHASSVAPALLAQLGLTNHALERFSTRAGLITSERRLVEPIIRQLLLTEGRVVPERPRWSPSRNHADLYVQLSDWMLCVCCRDDERRRTYAIVTIVKSPGSGLWPKAYRRGYIHTPPPRLMLRRRRPLLVRALRAVLATRRR
jgi:hypothetical protein